MRQPLIVYYGKKMSKFKKIVIDNKEYTALGFGQENYEIPPSILQTTREDCILVTDTDIVPFLWHGITKDKDGQYILFDDVELEPITLIATKYRSTALSLIRKIAIGLKTQKKKFLDLSSGIFPLYRIYIENGKNILLLSPDCGSILTLSRDRLEMDKAVKNLIKRDTEESFVLTQELVELMYYAISGVFPFEYDEVRGASFKPYSLDYYPHSSDNALITFIQNSLNLKTKKQRALCLNNGPEYPLGWFLDSTKALVWKEENRSEADLIFDKEKSEENPLFIKEKELKEKKSKTRKFWREKGAIIIVSVIVVSIVSYLIVNYLYQQFKAPLTKDLEPKEIIEYTIEQQNELDANEINEGFKKKAAQYDDVLTLFIANKTRSAYEGGEPLVPINDYLSGKEVRINQNSFVYGVIINSIEEIEENKYKASLTWYTPYAIDEGEEEKYETRDGFARTFVYDIDEYFTFSKTNRGWWTCTNSYFANENLIDVLYIPFTTTSETLSSS